MNSLPPELLSSIIDIAAHCDSRYGSYKARLETLSAISLANRYLHAVAQPLLARKVNLESDEQSELFVGACQMKEVTHLTLEWVWEVDFKLIPLWDAFSSLKELRIGNTSEKISLKGLNRHVALKRLTIEYSTIRLGVNPVDFILPHLEELSLDLVTVDLISDPSTKRYTFFSSARFPSLRAVGLRHVAVSTWGVLSHRLASFVETSFMQQLECLALDARSLEALASSDYSASPPTRFPAPLLLDLDVQEILDGLTSPLHPAERFPQSHLRLTFPYDADPKSAETLDTLLALEGLVKGNNQLEEMYLIPPQYGGVWNLWRDALREAVDQLELTQNAANVEIVWENPEDDCHFELTATLLSYGICLANSAAVLVSSLGSYEISSSVSSSAITTHDETVNQAADVLCRASGIFSHLAQTVIPRWEAAVGIESLRSRPIEFTRDAATALSKMCLADANLLAIRRLLSRSLSVAHSTTTPGPPLPPSHPSPSLLSKLHLQVYACYDEARSLFKSNHTSPTEISPLIRRYLSDGRQLALSLSYKWLGVDNGERSETGEALGWLGLASKALEELNDKDKGLGKFKIGKGKSAAKGRKGKVQEEIESVQACTKAYKKVNDTVHFQPIPDAQTLQARLPSGRPALALKPYSPSPPAFRPTSPANGSILPPKRVPPPPNLDGMGGLSLDDDSSDDDDDDANYAGAGQYF